MEFYRSLSVKHKVTSLSSWFSLHHPKPFFTLYCLILCSISFLLSVLLFINSCFSQFLMFILSLGPFFSLQSSVLSTQRDSESNIKAIHNLQDVLSAISIPTPQCCQHHTLLLSISLIFTALSNAAEWVCASKVVFYVFAYVHTQEP